MQRPQYLGVLPAELVVVCAGEGQYPLGQLLGVVQLGGLEEPEYERGGLVERQVVQAGNRHLLDARQEPRQAEPVRHLHQGQDVPGGDAGWQTVGVKVVQQALEVGFADSWEGDLKTPKHDLKWVRSIWNAESRNRRLE